MYRCRRFVAVLLSLALMASVFVFSVSADNESFGNFYIRYVTNGTGRDITLSEGAGMTFVFQPGSTINFSLSRVAIPYGTYTDIPVTITFDLYFFHSGNNHCNTNSYPNVNYSNCNISYFYWADYWLINEDLWGTYEYEPLAYRVELNCSYSANSINQISNANWTFSISNDYPNDTAHFGFVIRNLVITPAQTAIYNIFFRPFFESFESILTGTYNKLTDFYNVLCNQSVFPVETISFDGDGNASTTRADYTWHQSIYQLLSSLNAPVVQQVQQEQRAKEAGAMDALDSAYDKADDKLSFWSFLDLIDIGDLGEYDDDALEEAGEDSIIDWFSNACKNDIQGQIVNPLPSERSLDNEIVDFYQDNLDSIYDYFGGGSP